MDQQGIKHPERYPELADPQARPRYTGIATFFRAPVSDDPAYADIAVLGVPFDGGVTHRSGARHGPRAVREQSTMLRRHNAATGLSLWESPHNPPFGRHLARFISSTPTGDTA